MVKPIVAGMALWAALVASPAAVSPHAADQHSALARAHEKVDFIKDYRREEGVYRRMRLHKQGLTAGDIEHTYMLLDSPVLKIGEDLYGPVQFTHGQHAASINDCAACHHFRPEDDSLSETERCSACHQDAFDPDHPERIGLKAAYHLQCISCHEQQQRGPQACVDCHLQKVPDHQELVKLPDDPSPSDVTLECLRCHADAGRHVLTSAHWLWKGPSSYTAGHTKEIEHGKGTIALNNY